MSETPSSVVSPLTSGFISFQVFLFQFSYNDHTFDSVGDIRHVSTDGKMNSGDMMEKSVLKEGHEHPISTVKLHDKSFSTYIYYSISTHAMAGSTTAVMKYGFSVIENYVHSDISTLVNKVSDTLLYAVIHVLHSFEFSDMF